VLASVAMIVSSGSANRLPEDAGDAGAGVAREMAEQHPEPTRLPTEPLDR